MPNVNKVVFGNTTLIDLSTTSLSAASQLASGITAYDRAGNVITGTASGGGQVIITTTQDTHGGDIVTIVSDETIDLSGDTVAADKLLYGYTAHNSAGQSITGTYVPPAISLQAKTNIDPTTSSQTITADNDYDGLSSVQINAIQTQSKSATPSETAQTIEPDSGKYLSAVSVAAISSSYIGSGVAQRSSADLTASGATVTAPAGYYASAASAAVSSGTATTPATTITANPTISVNTSTGVITATASSTKSVAPTVSAGYVSSGTAGTITVSGSNTSNLTTQAAQTIHPSSSDQTVTSGKYLTGTQTFKAVTLTNLTAANIKSGVVVKVGDSTDDDCVTSVTGTYTGSGGTGMNKQIYYGPANVKNNGYIASSATLTVATTGTYKVSWTAWRSSSQGTMGTNLYRNSTAGTNQQTFTGTYGQCITLTDQSYTAGDVLTIYATSGSNSRTIYIANFVIEQTA